MLIREPEARGPEEQRKGRRTPAAFSIFATSCDQVLSADMMSPNRFQVSPLKVASWTDCTG